MNLTKILILAVKKLDYLSLIAIRLTKLTGKSSEPIHPKHLVSKKPWFIKYLNKNDTVLDLGSGNGQNSIKAGRAVRRVVGVDYDDRLLDLAGKSAKSKNVSFKKLNLEEKLPFSDNSFDKILFFDVLEHLRRRDQILKEIKRILKQTGLLLVNVPNKNTSWKKLQRKHGVCSFSDTDHKIEYSSKQIKRLIENDFTIDKFMYDKYDTPLRPIHDVIGAIWLTAYKKILEQRQKKANLLPREASGFQIVAKPTK